MLLKSINSFGWIVFSITAMIFCLDLIGKVYSIDFIELGTWRNEHHFLWAVLKLISGIFLISQIILCTQRLSINTNYGYKKLQIVKIISAGLGFICFWFVNNVGTRSSGGLSKHSSYNPHKPDVLIDGMLLPISKHDLVYFSNGVIIFSLIVFLITCYIEEKKFNDRN